MCFRMFSVACSSDAMGYGGDKVKVFAVSRVAAPRKIIQRSINHRATLLQTICKKDQTGSVGWKAHCLLLVGCAGILLLPSLLAQK
jgi:hypothetical protein